MTVKEEAAAKAGAELLDMTADEMPHLVASNWFEIVDLGCLWMAYAKQCVLGQLMPERDFLDACEALGLVEEAQMVGAGFAAGGENSYDALNQAWTKEVLARRATAGAVNPLADTSA